jgi:hypothetical protein
VQTKSKASFSKQEVASQTAFSHQQVVDALGNKAEYSQQDIERLLDIKQLMKDQKITFPQALIAMNNPNPAETTGFEEFTGDSDAVGQMPQQDMQFNWDSLELEEDTESPASGNAIELAMNAQSQQMQMQGLLLGVQQIAGFLMAVNDSQVRSLQLALGQSEPENEVEAQVATLLRGIVGRGNQQVMQQIITVAPQVGGQPAVPMLRLPPRKERLGLAQLNPTQQTSLALYMGLQPKAALPAAVVDEIPAEALTEVAAEATATAASAPQS